MESHRDIEMGRINEEISSFRVCKFVNHIEGDFHCYVS